MTTRISNLTHEFVPVTVAQGVVAITGTVTVVDSTTIVLADATGYLQIQIETATVRLTLGGTTPSATVGQRYTAGQELLLSRSEWLASRWVREGATSAGLQIIQFATK